MKKIYIRTWLVLSVVLAIIDMLETSYGLKRGLEETMPVTIFLINKFGIDLGLIIGGMIRIIILYVMYILVVNIFEKFDMLRKIYSRKIRIIVYTLSAFVITVMLIGIITSIKIVYENYLLIN